MGGNKPPIKPRPPKKYLIGWLRIPPCDPLDVFIFIVIIGLYALNVAHQFIPVATSDYVRDLSKPDDLRWFIYDLGLYTTLFALAWGWFSSIPYKYSFRKSLLLWVSLDWTWELIDLIVYDNRHSDTSFFWEQGLIILFFIYSLYKSYKWKKRLKDVTVHI